MPSIKDERSASWTDAMSIRELSQLVRALEEYYGVSPAAAALEQTDVDPLRQLALTRLVRVLAAVARLRESTDTAYLEGALALISIQLERAQHMQIRLQVALDRHDTGLRRFSEWADGFFSSLAHTQIREGEQ